MLKNKTYDKLKWFFLIVCPALAILVGTLGDTWGIANTEAWVVTINAVGVFGGAILGASTYTYNQSKNG